MAEPSSKPKPAEAGKDRPAPASAAPPNLKRLWPIPALVLGAAGFAAGLWALRGPRAEPDYAAPLKHAESLVEAGEFQGAIDELNGAARGYIDSGKASSEERVRFHLARARAFTGAQDALGASLEPNHRTIISDYLLVEELGHPLEPDDVARLARSQVAMGEIDLALSRVGSLPASHRPVRMKLTRLVIEHNLAAPASQRRDAMTLDLLAALATDPDAGPDDRAWVLSRQCDLLLSAGQFEEAITKLLREMQRLHDVPRSREGELHVLLGRAYFEAGQVDAASRQLESAEAMLDRGSLLRADAALLAGRIAQGRGEAGRELARERFMLVISEFRSTSAYAPAVLGLAEIEAASHEFEASIERYAEIIALVKSGIAAKAGPVGHGDHPAESHAPDSHAPAGGHEAHAAAPAAPDAHGKPSAHDAKPDAAHHAEHGAKEHAPAPSHEPAPHGGIAAHAVEPASASLGDVTVERVSDSLLAQAAERHKEGDRELALRFALLAESLFAAADAPGPVLLVIAQASRELADERLERARAEHATDFRITDLDPVNRAEVKRHYLAAGDYFKRHADRVAATDPGTYAESLWTAADSYDRAGDAESARKAFSTYIDGASETDPNRAAAKFRLAQIFQSQGDFNSSTAIYEDLRAAGDGAAQPAASGTWSDRSIVPLALCYLADKDPANDLRAETLLRSVVDGSLLSPDARDYREALWQLGNMYYTLGRYPDAIVRFEEVLRRYGAEPAADAGSLGTLTRARAAATSVDATRYKLADSHRLEAQRILVTLSTALPQAVEAELKTARTEHLRAAMAAYDQVRQSLDAADASRLTELERLFLRNACFYVGDCAYELGDYARAIAAYDAAALKYADDPASLVALVQIVGAYVAQGQLAQARTANERARRQLARFPDEAWSRPDLPMEKRHWERWLDARGVLERGESANATGGGTP